MQTSKKHYFTSHFAIKSYTIATLVSLTLSVQLNSRNDLEKDLKTLLEKAKMLITFCSLQRKKNIFNPLPHNPDF